MQAIKAIASKKIHKALTALTLLFTMTITSLPAESAQAQNVEERFQDLFITAGYATAFGAAVGTAFLAFHEDPSRHLRYVAMGASLGFIGGSLLGSYVIFSPMVGENSDDASANSLIASNSVPSQGIAVRPTWNQETKSLAAVEAGMTLINF
jgi:hypothetical protein